MSALSDLVKYAQMGDVVYKRGDHEHPYTGAEEAAHELAVKNAHIANLEQVGELMSNVFFNWSQQERFTPDERKMMKDLQTQWDAIRIK